MNLYNVDGSVGNLIWLVMMLASMTVGVIIGMWVRYLDVIRLKEELIKCYEEVQKLRESLDRTRKPADPDFDGFTRRSHGAWPLPPDQM